MRYRNKNTGTVIEISSELISPDWEEVTAPAGDNKKEADNGNSLRKRKRHSSSGDKPDSTAAGGS